MNSMRASKLNHLSDARHEREFIRERLSRNKCREHGFDPCDGYLEGAWVRSVRRLLGGSVGSIRATVARRERGFDPCDGYSGQSQVHWNSRIQLMLSKKEAHVD